MTPVAQLAWEEGHLVSRAPQGGARVWACPADLAAARLACDAPVSDGTLGDGRALLTAAFTVVPFVRGPFPAPVFGAGVTPAAQRAFRAFLDPSGGAPADDFRVLRAEPDAFLVFAWRIGAVWRIGAFVADAVTLTVRFEDVWQAMPATCRAGVYRVEVWRDAHRRDTPEAQARGLVEETLAAVAPDARICLDVAAGGGFVLAFHPIVAESRA